MLNLFHNSVKSSVLLIGILNIVSCGGSSSSKQADTSSPIFTSHNSFSIEENKTEVTSVIATDNSTVSYSVSGGDDASEFEISSTTGALSFKIAPDYDAPTDADSNNIYIVDVTATDSSTNSRSQSITVTVTREDNTPPVFTSSSTVSIIEEQLNVLTVQVTDESSITLSISGGEDASKLQIDSNTGVLTFKVAPDFEIPTDSDENNSYIVEILATDTSNNASSQIITVTITDINLTLLGDYSVVSLGKGFNSTEMVNLGTKPKTLYALFTNNDRTNITNPFVKHESFKSAPTLQAKRKITPIETVHTAQGSHAPSHIHEFNKTSRYLLNTNEDISPRLKVTAPQRKEVESGDKRIFTTDIYYDTPSNTQHDVGDIKDTIEATARLVRTVNTEQFGPKTLNIWVADDSYGAHGKDCTKFAADTSEDTSFCLTPELIESLADKFLQTGPDNDIYDWVTNIYGEEWGDRPHNYLIPETNKITILLTDIDSDSDPTGGVIGFFTAVNNFSTSAYAGSNEEIMFYLDSVMYGNDEAGAGKFQKLIYATLAHEFTHMIEYYQKDILTGFANNADISSDTWLAEMTAEATEYLTSKLAGHDSPRGIPYYDGTDGTASLQAPDKIDEDRFPDFNKYNNTFTLTTFKNTIEDYSKVSSFGAFLMNNYGGPELLHDIVHSTEVDENAVVAAVNHFMGTGTITFSDLLRDWGVAVLLSDIINPELGIPHFNAGDFTTTSYDGIDYDIGSINFFNYVTGNNVQNVFDFGPTIRTTPITEESPIQVQPHGNFFYKVGDNLTGSFEIKFEADSNTEITLIAK